MLAVVVAPMSVRAQSLAVRVVDSGSGQPIRGAMVTLSEDPDRVVSRRLTDVLGIARFRPEAGVYGIEAQMIGHLTGRRTGIAVSAGTRVELVISLDPTAIPILGVDVDVDERCAVRPEEGLQVAQVWGEIRKALEAARWTADRGLYEYRIERGIRDIDRRTGQVLNEEIARREGYAPAPFETLPAARLVAEGFVQPAPDGGGSIYYGPDAEVLLSDDFLDTHCMRAIVGRGAREGWIGLSFDPVRERRVPDIGGTLWVDPESWELRHLDYWYENLRLDVAVRDIGGDIRFQRLPDGTWIIPEWTVRVPLLGRGRDLRGRPRIHQVGVREETGRVLRVRHRDGRVLLTAGSGTIEGTVVDSLGSSPVQGARVELVGDGRTATTDASGGFVFTDLEPGRYHVTLGGSAAAPYENRTGQVTVSVEADRVTPTRLRIPSRMESLTRLCDPEAASDDRRHHGRVVGRIVDQATGLALPGARVAINWNVTNGLALIGDSEGRYAACAVPRSAVLSMTPSWGSFTGAAASITMPDEDRLVVHDLSVPVQGLASLSGTIRESSTGIPVEGARVELQVDGQTVREVISDADGSFMLQEVPAGAHRLGVYHSSYRGGSDRVRARPGEQVDLSVELTRVPREIGRLLPELATRMRGVSVRVSSRELTTPPPAAR